MRPPCGPRVARRRVGRHRQRLPQPPSPERLGAAGLAELGRLIAQRLAGTPLAHLTGRQSFLGVELLAGPEALVPRKETELLAETAIGRLDPSVPATVLDVCTGSGNLAAAIAVARPLARSRPQTSRRPLWSWLAGTCRSSASATG